MTGTGKSGRVPTQKKSAVCTDISVCLIQIPSARAAPAQPHTAWRCEGEDILMEMSSRREDTSGGFYSGEVGYSLLLGEVI